MFRYINMPKLVAHYLREFSVQKDGLASTLYKFIFCLCLPFVSKTFYLARLKALAIAECTNSQDQITRVLEAITGATVEIVPLSGEYYVAYNGTDDSPDFPFDNSDDMDNALVPYVSAANAGYIYITLNGASRSEVEAYLPLLIPFYVHVVIVYVDEIANVVTSDGYAVTTEDGRNVTTYI